jgi:hypothetical protein
MHHARRLAVIIGVTIGWLSPLAHATSWIIELTNGGRLTTTHVWEEGKELKFFIAEGTAGVPRILVKRIKPAALVDDGSGFKPARPMRPMDPPASPPSDVPPAGGQSSSVQETKEDGNRSRQAGVSQSDREKKLVLTTHFDDARKKYLEAMSARNLVAEQGALEEMRAESKRIYALADEVKAKHGGVLPAWWNE